MHRAWRAANPERAAENDRRNSLTYGRKQAAIRKAMKELGLL